MCNGLFYLFYFGKGPIDLSYLFRRKSIAIVIPRSSSSCKNYNVAHCSKSLKGINTKHGIFAHQDKGHNSESYSCRMVVPDRRALLPHAVCSEADCRPSSL